MGDPLESFANALPGATPVESFQALHQLCDAVLGVKLFTCSRFDLSAGKAERVYTNDAISYPLAGLKDIVPNRWTEIVLDRRKPFVAARIEDLRDVFPDHELIESLGLGAAINLPVIVGGRMLGTANLLHSDGHYSDHSLTKVSPLLVAATAAFLYFESQRGTG